MGLVGLGWVLAGCLRVRGSGATNSLVGVVGGGGVGRMQAWAGACDWAFPTLSLHSKSTQTFRRLS